MQAFADALSALPRTGIPSRPRLAYPRKAAGGTAAMTDPPCPPIDFRGVFQAAAPTVLLAPPEFRIVAANDAYLDATGAIADRLLGRPLCETVSAAARDHADPDTADQLRASLQRVMSQHEADTMAPVKHSHPPSGGVNGERDEHWWVPTNAPLFDQHHEVALIIHRLEDATAIMRLRDAHDRLAQDRQQLLTQLRRSSDNAAKAQAERAASRSALAKQSRLVAATLTSLPDCVYAFDRNGRCSYANRATLKLLGLSLRQMRGKTFAELGHAPDAVARMEEFLARVLATGEVIEDEVFYVSPAGYSGYFEFVWGPLRNEEGEIEQVVGVSRETSQRHRLEEHLRQTEARQAFLLQLGDRVRNLTDACEVMAAAAELLGRHLRVGRCGYGEVDEAGECFTVAREWTDGRMPRMASPVPLADFSETVLALYRTGRNVVIEDTHEDARTRGINRYTGREAGGVRAGIGVPLVKNGRFVAAFYVHQTRPRRWADVDIALVEQVAERTWAAVTRARLQRALRESEERYRLLFDSIDQGLCTLQIIHGEDGEPVDYVFTDANQAFERQTGLVGAIGKHMRELAPEQEQHGLDIYGRVAHTGVAERFEMRARALGRYYDAFAFRIGHPQQTQVAVLFYDITDRKHHEQHQKMLLNELNHRVKNTLATIQSIATQTLANATDCEHARRLLEGRLMALSMAHNVLTRESWSGAALLDIVKDALSPYRDLRSDRLHIDGPRVWLAPRHALAFAMALHELCTNAAKYGALSDDAGRISVVWTLAPKGEGCKLCLRWTEAGGPPVRAPSRRGFGSRLIERGLKHEFGGKVRLEFPPSGVVCTIETQLDAASSADPKGASQA